MFTSVSGQLLVGLPPLPLPCAPGAQHGHRHDHGPGLDDRGASAEPDLVHQQPGHGRTDKVAEREGGGPDAGHQGVGPVGVAGLHGGGEGGTVAGDEDGSDTAAQERQGGDGAEVGGGQGEVGGWADLRGRGLKTASRMISTTTWRWELVWVTLLIFDLKSWLLQ